VTDTEVTFREVAWVPVEQLRRFPGNANHGDVPAIRESLRRTGQYRALIVRRDPDDGTLTVLAGNNTLDALRAEGVPRARVEIHECDDHTALRINVADNKIARAAVVDDDALLEQLSYLDGDYTGSGFTQGEINHLLGEGGFADDLDHETAGVDASGLLDDDATADPDDGGDTTGAGSDRAAGPDTDPGSPTGDTPDDDPEPDGDGDDESPERIRVLQLIMPAHHYPHAADGLTELADRYGVDTRAAALTRLVTDALGVEPPDAP